MTRFKSGDRVVHKYNKKYGTVTKIVMHHGRKGDFQVGCEVEWDDDHYDYRNKGCRFPPAALKKLAKKCSTQET